MKYEQYVLIEWRNTCPFVERFVSDEPITLDVLKAHYEADDANWERDALTLIDEPETIELGG